MITKLDMSSHLAGGKFNLVQLSEYIEYQKIKASRLRQFIAICELIGIDKIGE